MRIEHRIPVEAGQTFQVDRFRDGDAAGIASLFFSVYGSEYPFDTYYIPERIIEENHNGNIYSVVARTSRGDIIGHGALYRSSPHHQGLYEIGQYIVLPDYRSTFAAFQINQYIGGALTEHVHPDGIFGEAVCTHLTTQKSSALIGMKATALEVGLMPSEAYEKEGGASSRVSCLIQFRSFNDRPHEVFIPKVYGEIIDLILGDCSISRAITPSAGAIPKGCTSQVAEKYLVQAGVARSNVVLAGADLDQVLVQFEERAVKEGIVVLQCFLNLGVPWIGAAVELLRARGYFLGGYTPRWFDTDGLLMQKNLTQPDFDSISLHSEKSKKIKEYVKADWERAWKQASQSA